MQITGLTKDVWFDMNRQTKKYCPLTIFKDDKCYHCHDGHWLISQTFL